MRTTSRTTALAAAAVIALMTLSGCGGDDDQPGSTPASSQDAGGGDTTDLGDAAEEFGIPEECFTVHIGTFGEPDIDSVDKMPADWPEPIDDAVLCGTSSTNTEQNANYVSSAAPSEILDAYEGALGDAGYETSREDPSGLGRDMLTGSSSDVYFQVDAKDGGFTVTFASE
ncbi:hypothetical protein KM427_24455 [Nocardioides sp. LMS-CY]|uniref:hypothetical protein n=1 Tax=Nocardioides sp. (strain LMS-CY) TaxID=2840457 RepID=UPI001C007075|nr:hypothetical protein [Nocardioides sp. LMS-CY]QWF22014.1 hypothetical protein KM427_24455 [Nocardioides sp. LMS-CY]